MVDDRQLAQGRAWHRPAPIGKRYEAVARGQQFFGQLGRGTRVELRDVAMDLADFSKRCRRPDYLHGGGAALPLASLRSHCRAFLCETPCPASISASASAIARASSVSSISSKIDFASSMVSPLRARRPAPSCLWKVSLGIAEIKSPSAPSKQPSK